MSENVDAAEDEAQPRAVLAAKDIPDDLFLSTVDALERKRGGWTTWGETHDALVARLGDFSPKITLAKANRLMGRGLMDGCGCGCRGDFTLTDLMTGERLWQA